MAAPSSALSALLSLSTAAASVHPIPTASKKDGSPPGHGLGTGAGRQSALKHRRLSSTGQTRRRMSEARDAASRPIVASLNMHSAASALASLSLTSATSPPATALTHAQAYASVPHNAVPIPISAAGHSSRRAVAKSVPIASLTGFGSSVENGGTSLNSGGADDSSALDIEVDVEDEDEDNANEKDKRGKPARGKNGKKRGTIFKCESCSKVYRHPSCLVKHRWEHSPHWREASKFLLSKHQQVQMLEAAAILTHLQPGSSLPEDRSLWPSYLSNGLLPPPSTATTSLTVNGTTTSKHVSSSPSQPISSSVPVTTSVPMRARSGSVSTPVPTSGPRMHNYTLPGGGGSGIKQIRPGLLGHPTGPTSAGTATPVAAAPYTDEGRLSSSLSAASKPMAVPFAHTHSSTGYRESAAASSVASASVAGSFGERDVGSYSDRFRDREHEFEHDNELEGGTGGWSLPRSDLRSDSLSLSYSESQSRSRSGSRSDEAEVSDMDDIDVDVEDGSVAGSVTGPRGYAGFNSTRYGGYPYGFANRPRARDTDADVQPWKREDDEYSVGFSARDEFEEEPEAKHHERAQDDEWVGMDMEL